MNRRKCGAAPAGPVRRFYRKESIFDHSSASYSVPSDTNSGHSVILYDGILSHNSVGTAVQPGTGSKRFDQEHPPHALAHPQHSCGFSTSVKIASTGHPAFQRLRIKSGLIPVIMAHSQTLFFSPFQVKKVGVTRCLMHPQDFLCPLRKFVPRATALFPQSHWHTQYVLLIADVREMGYSAINLPNRRPEMSAVLENSRRFISRHPTLCQAGCP
nr:MAG TPA: hypothetical protein [Caudoviricetes sp.]